MSGALGRGDQLIRLYGSADQLRLASRQAQAANRGAATRPLTQPWGCRAKDAGYEGGGPLGPHSPAPAHRSSSPQPIGRGHFALLSRQSCAAVGARHRPCAPPHRCRRSRRRGGPVSRGRPAHGGPHPMSCGQEVVAGADPPGLPGVWPQGLSVAAAPVGRSQGLGSGSCTTIASTGVAFRSSPSPPSTASASWAAAVSAEALSNL